MRGELFSNSHQQVGLSQWKDYTCPTQCNINLNLLFLLWILRGAFPSFKHTPFQINGSLSHFAFISGCTCVSIPFHLWRGTWRELMTAPHLVLQLHKKFSRGTEGQQCSSSDCDVITQIQILACGFKAQRCSKKRKRKKEDIHHCTSFCWYCDSPTSKWQCPMFSFHSLHISHCPLCEQLLLASHWRGRKKKQLVSLFFQTTWVNFG